MFGSIGIYVAYEVPYDEDSLRAVFLAVQEVIDRNWSVDRDEWTAPGPNCLVNVEKWLKDCAPEKLHRVAGDLDDPTETFSEELIFSFSPLSAYVARLVASKRPDAKLACKFRVSPSVLWERAGYREKDRMESEWLKKLGIRYEEAKPPVGPPLGHPDYDAWWERRWKLDDTPFVGRQNRECILRFLEKLRSLFPVQYIRIDEELSQVPSGDDS